MPGSPWHPPWEAEGKGLWKFKERHLPSRLYTQPSGCSGVVQRSSMTINRQRGRQRDGEMGWGTGSEPALAGIWSSHRLRAQKRCGLFRPRCFRQAKFAPAEPIFEHNTPPVTSWRSRKEPGPRLYGEVPRRCCGTSSHVLQIALCRRGLWR